MDTSSACLIALCEQPLSKVIEPFSLNILPFTTQIISRAAAFESLLSRVKIGFDATTSEKSSTHFLAFSVKDSFLSSKSTTNQDASLRANGIPKLNGHYAILFFLEVEKC